MTTTAPAVPPPEAAADPTPVTSLPPLKPRRSLLVLAVLAFAVWTLFLVFLYVTTVYPERHPAKPAGQVVERDK